MQLSTIKQISVSKIILTVFFTLFGLLNTWAQAPTHVPREKTEPVNFFESTENIVFFVVLPVLIVILYFLWKRNLKKQQEDKENQGKENQK